MTYTFDNDYSRSAILGDAEVASERLTTAWNDILKELTWYYLGGEHLTKATAHRFKLQKYTEDPFSCVFFFDDKPEWIITQSFYDIEGNQYFRFTQTRYIK